MKSETDCHAGVLLIKKEKREIENLKIEYLLYSKTCTNVTLYSIEIITDSGAECESETAEGITEEYDKAEEIFNVLVNGNVTSCTLYEIIEDML